MKEFQIRFTVLNTGAKSGEVAVMNQLTSNLHFLLVRQFECSFCILCVNRFHSIDQHRIVSRFSTKNDRFQVMNTLFIRI